MQKVKHCFFMSKQTTIKQHMYNNQTSQLYASLGVTGTTYQISFNELLSLVGTLENKTCLDFGCGAGRSTKLLQTLNLSKIVGIDHNFEMVQQAQQKYNDLTFEHISSDELPFPDTTFDIVFALHVLCEIKTKAAMQAVVKEIARILKPGGNFYVITTNPEAFGHEFVSYRYGLPKTFQDEESVACHVKTQPPFTINDTFWSLEGYENIFQGHFEISNKAFPLGSGPQWLDETKVAPDILYKLQKLD